MRTRRIDYGSAVIALCSMFGCAESDAGEGTRTGGIGRFDAGVNDAGGANGDSDGGSAGGGGGMYGDASVDLTDAQILAVMTTANLGAMAQADAALQGLDTIAAATYAELMLRASEAAQARQRILANIKGLVPSDNPISVQLSRVAAAVNDQLEAASDDDRDRVYMDAQVVFHVMVLEIFDEVLIPSAADPQMLSEVQRSREESAAFVRQARAVLDFLD